MWQGDKPGICIVSIIDAICTILLILLNRVENPLNRRRSTVLARLNISAVESKFFLHPFTCLAKNTEGISTAYIQLIHPGKQESHLFEMQLCIPMVRYHDLEVCHAISSAHNALRFLLTWGLPFTLLLRWTVSSVKFFCPTFLLLTHLSAYVFPYLSYLVFFTWL